MKHILILFFLTTLIMGCNRSNQMKSLDAEAFYEEINSNQSTLLIDVRTPGEFEKGHIENAINIDWNGNDFEAEIKKLDPSKPVYVYCLSGGRSGKSVERLKGSGFKNITELKGGMMEWRAKNLPENTKSGVPKGMSLEDYQEKLNEEQWVLVDFYADWCAPCKKMAPYLQKISEEYSDKLILIKTDADIHSELCKKLNVNALPVLKLYKNQELIWEHSGYIEEEKIREIINTYL